MRAKNRYKKSTVKSIYKQFYQKLIFATSLFIVTLSFIFYGYTKATMYEEIKKQVLEDAQLIHKLILNSSATQSDLNIIKDANINVDLLTIKDLESISYKNYTQERDFFVELLYPIDLKNSKFLKITKNINSTKKNVK